MNSIIYGLVPLFALVILLIDYRSDPGKHRWAKIVHAIVVPGLILMTLVEMSEFSANFLKDKGFEAYVSTHSVLPFWLDILFVSINVFFSMLFLVVGFRMLVRDSFVLNMFYWFFPIKGIFTAYYAYTIGLDMIYEPGLESGENVLLFLWLYPLIWAIFWGGLWFGITMVYKRPFMRNFYFKESDVKTTHEDLIDSIGGNSTSPEQP